jgi:PDZ domain
MNRWLNLLTAIGIALAGFHVEARAADPLPEEQPAPTPAEIRGWITSLASERFDVRELATKKLGKAGRGGIQPLAEAAQGESLEVTCRAIRALEAIADQGDPATFEGAQSVLERLAESTNRSVARRADVALRALSGARHRHALAKIVELGGIVKLTTRTKGIVVPSDTEEMPLVQVILNKRWKGGDAGLVHLRRIERLQALYVTKGATFSPEALDDLARDIAPLEIQTRGEAMLGVSCSAQGTECIIDRVSPDSAAEKAGLKAGDTIIKYDGQEIMQFSRLIEITNSHSAGDKVPIEIIRNEKLMKLEAVLTEWQ